MHVARQQIVDARIAFEMMFDGEIMRDETGLQLGIVFVSEAREIGADQSAPGEIVEIADLEIARRDAQEFDLAPRSAGERDLFVEIVEEFVAERAPVAARDPVFLVQVAQAVEIGRELAFRLRRCQGDGAAFAVEFERAANLIARVRTQRAKIILFVVAQPVQVDRAALLGGMQANPEAGCLEQFQIGLVDAGEAPFVPRTEEAFGVLRCQDMFYAARGQLGSVGPVAQEAVVLDAQDVDFRFAGFVEIELAQTKPAMACLAIGAENAQPDEYAVVGGAKDERLQSGSVQQSADPAPRHIEVDVGACFEVAPFPFELGEVFERRERQAEVRHALGLQPFSG